MFLVLLKWEIAAILGNGCGVQWQNYGEVARWERWESGEVGRWEVPSFIQGWGPEGVSKILSFCF